MLYCILLQLPGSQVMFLTSRTTEKREGRTIADTWNLLFTCSAKSCFCSGRRSGVRNRNSTPSWHGASCVRATCCQWFVNSFFGKRAAHTDPCILWSTMDANFQCLRCRAFPAGVWCDTQTSPCSCSVLCTDSTRSAHAISSLPCLRPASFSAMASTPAKRISSSSWICGRPHSYHNVSCVICTLILQVARESTLQTCATQSTTQARVGYRKRGEKQRTKACATCLLAEYLSDIEVTASVGWQSLGRRHVPPDDGFSGAPSRAGRKHLRRLRGEMEKTGKAFSNADGTSGDTTHRRLKSETSM